MIISDAYGCDVTANSHDTVALWNAALADYLDFSGTPVQHVQEIADTSFVLGPVFCAAMKLLSGHDPNGASVRRNVAAMRAASPTATPAEQRHAHAIEHMLVGEFSQAALVWDTILSDNPNDMLAHKCAHETWFLVGKTDAMLASSRRAIAALTVDDPCFAVAAAQHGFALEETGAYAEAESWGRLALDMRPTDCWALHCLAHVYETQNRHRDAMDLLETRKSTWRKQNLLDAHIWWHLALRQIEIRAYDDALAIFDRHLQDVDPSNRFRLTDGTSLLWRLELAGVDVGDRWRAMADKWSQNASLHTVAFLDLHAAMAFARCPDSVAAETFHASLRAGLDGQISENADIFKEVVLPILDIIATLPHSPAAADKLREVLPRLHRIGGSVVQREIFERSYSSALLATGRAAELQDWLKPKMARHPNTPWILRAAADAAAAQGNTARATLLQRRSDLMFGGM